MADDRRAALGASIGLHLGLAAAALIALRHTATLVLDGPTVAVTVVAAAPEAAPAPPAPPTTAPAPVQAAPSEPAPPRAPTKRVAEARPTTVAVPRRAVPKELDPSSLTAGLPKPTARPSKALDLSALAADLPKSAPRPQKALDLGSLASSLAATKPHAAAARPIAGAASGVSSEEIGALKAKLIRLWNPNCGVEGAGAVVVRIRMRLGAGGELSEPPQIAGSSGDAPAEVVRAAAGRALGAVARGAPYTEITPEHLKSLHDFIFKFDARQACNG